MITLRFNQAVRDYTKDVERVNVLGLEALRMLYGGLMDALRRTENGRRIAKIMAQMDVVEEEIRLREARELAQA